jgi:hypothetical protein
MSLKGDKYETAEEIRFRLENTIVLYEGLPVFITKTRRGDELVDDKDISRVYFQKMPFKRGQKEERRYLSSKKFDLKPFPMGYFNSEGKALYASRRPVRQNKQGLSANTLIIDDDGRQRGGFGFEDIIRDQGFCDMILGVYPSFKDAGDIIDKDGCNSVAISRAFALAMDDDLGALILKNRGVSCGLAFKGDRGFRLAPKYHFLKEELEEHKIPIV